MDNFREFRLTAILSGAELAGGEAKKKKRRRKEGEKKERDTKRRFRLYFHRVRSRFNSARRLTGVQDRAAVLEKKERKKKANDHVAKIRDSRIYSRFYLT